jgi:hypothetical protein
VVPINYQEIFRNSSGNFLKPILDSFSMFLDLFVSTIDAMVTVNHRSTVHRSTVHRSHRSHRFHRSTIHRSHRFTGPPLTGPPVHRSTAHRSHRPTDPPVHRSHRPTGAPSTDPPAHRSHRSTGGPMRPVGRWAVDRWPVNRHRCIPNRNSILFVLNGTSIYPI